MMSQPSRRAFLKTTGLSASALILGVGVSTESQAETVVNLLPGAPGSAFTLTQFVKITSDDKITLTALIPDMGQGTYQALPAILAEELNVPLSAVTIEFTKGETSFGDQTAGGSSSVRGNYAKLRKVGAAAREMLIQAASAKWQVSSAECYADAGKVVHKPSGKSLSYGELVEAASQLEVPKEPKLKDENDFTILGKPQPKPDVPWKVTGRPIFGMDVTVPGMVYASVQHCPVVGGTVKSFDATAAKAVKGVLDVLRVDRRLGDRVTANAGVAVVADSYWAATQGRKKLKIDWDTKGYEKTSTAGMETTYRQLAKHDGVTDKAWGDFGKAFAEAPVKLEAAYETPFLSHSPMEPQNATVWVKDDKVEVWASIQGPDLIVDDLHKHLGVPKENITVHVCFSGGGFGRRLFPDVATEAALLSKRVGKPVKLIWSREDDTTQGPFRPATFSFFKAGLNAEGKPVAFQHKVVSPSIVDYLYQHDRAKPAGEMMEAISDMAYEIPNVDNRYVFAENHLPLGWWRAVTSTTTAFAHECFVDELAAKAGVDPLEFRLRQLTKPSPVKAILQALKEKSGWEKPLTAGKGRGVAVWEFFAGACGQVVEVSRDKQGKLRIDKVTAVIDLGTVVNPDTVRAQVEGAVCMALTAATKDAMTFVNGTAEQTNFDRYRMTRLAEMPPVEVHILTGDPKMKGVGEPGLPPFAPALANAIFSLSGQRIRKLPFELEKV
jgi:isoquinoline 1-oxidoreductase beta subunit